MLVSRAGVAVCHYSNLKPLEPAPTPTLSLYIALRGAL